MDIPGTLAILDTQDTGDTRHRRHKTKTDKIKNTTQKTKR
jgi:hypothetical protein